VAHILIIDDSSVTRSVLKSTLEELGHRITEAVDGEQGLELAKAQTPDLILLDLLLPGIDGWQVCELFRKMPRVKDVPIIMLTNLKTPVDKLRGWESGADEYIFKTEDLGPLLFVINKWLSPDPDR